MIRAPIATLAVPAYLFLALLLGGSTRGIWGNMALQLLAIALLAWAVLSPAREPWPQQARPLVLVAVAGLLLILLQLVPVPPVLWSGLPGRGGVAEGYTLLGAPLPWLPLSLNPYGSLASSLALLPPIAVAAVILTKPQRESWLAAALLAGALLLIAFLACWSRLAFRLWRSPGASRLARAATIVSAAVLVQSLVDYPLRTAAIASLFGLCVGLMARPAGRGDKGHQGAGRPRHVVIG